MSAGTPPPLPTSQNGPSGLAEWKPSGIPSAAIAALQSVPAFPARMIHEGSTATADTLLRQASMLIVYILADGLAPPDLDVLLRVRLGLSGLRAPVSLGVSTVSSRTPINHTRQPRLGGSQFFRRGRATACQRSEQSTVRRTLFFAWNLFFGGCQSYRTHLWV
jgi:hypothetical protein